MNGVNGVNGHHASASSTGIKVSSCSGIGKGCCISTAENAVGIIVLTATRYRVRSADHSLHFSHSAFPRFFVLSYFETCSTMNSEY